jgi:hypothetical protein
MDQDCYSCKKINRNVSRGLHFHGCEKCENRHDVVSPGSLFFPYNNTYSHNKKYGEIKLNQSASA